MVCPPFNIIMKNKSIYCCCCCCFLHWWHVTPCVSYFSHFL